MTWSWVSRPAFFAPLIISEHFQEYKVTDDVSVYRATKALEKVIRLACGLGSWQVALRNTSSFPLHTLARIATPVSDDSFLKEHRNHLGSRSVEELGNFLNGSVLICEKVADGNPPFRTRK